MSSTDPGRPAQGRWTSRRTVVVAGVLGAALVAGAASQRWGSGTASGQVVGIRAVSASGGELSPLVPGLALVGGAAAVAAATTGRVARRVAIVALGLAGLGVVAATLLVLSGLATALGERAASLSARTEAVPMRATATAWPWVAVAGGLVLVVAAALAARGLSSWPTPSRRYERTEGAHGEVLSDDLTLWDRVGRELDADENPPSRRPAGQESGTPDPSRERDTR